MPTKTFYELASNVVGKLESEYKAKFGDNYSRENVARSAAVLAEQLKPTSSNKVRMPMTEALRSDDASVLFPRVISDTLLRPREPWMIGQALIAKTVYLDNVKSVEFPVLGALRASVVGEGQEYPDQILPATKQVIDLKTQKHGLKVSITKEMIEDSMWDIVALHIEAAGYALARHKEELIWNEFSTVGHKVFDNNGTDSNGYTTGKDIHQASNYSVAFNDFIFTMGALVSQGYTPTDIIMHPLAWAVFATDPIIRNVMYTQSQIGQTVWTSPPMFDQQANVPWNLSYQVSPFCPLAYGAQLTGPGSGLAATNITDIYVVDRNHAAIILQRDDPSVDTFEEPLRDLQSMKISERYTVGTVNEGRAVAVLSNVRLETNWAPYNAFYSVTPS